MSAAAATVSANTANTATPVRRGRRWPWVLLGLVALFVAAAWGLWLVLGHSAALPLDVVIDGEPVLSGWDPSSLPPAHRVVLAAVLGLLLLAALVAVPMALLAVAAVVLLVLLAVLALPLLAVALLLSPLLLAGWILVSLLS